MELLPLLKVQNCAGRAYRADRAERAERADSNDRADRKNTFKFVYKIETMTDRLKRLANLKISDGPKCLK